MKRLLALLLTICMVASFGSSYAAAENTETDTKTEATNTEPTIDEKDSNINLEPTDGIINTNAIVPELTYSTLVSWDETTMWHYNCYSYVLGITTKRYDPGEFSNPNQEYDGSLSIQAMANLVIDDLHTDELGGYSCVYKQSGRPSYINDATHIIAIRKQENNKVSKDNDYHVAKLLKSGWYHKPGGSAILKFRNPPSNSVIWTDENYYDGYYHSPKTTYTSKIMYIIYSNTHRSTSYTWTKNHYHANGYHYFQYGYKCDDCGTYTKKVWTKKACSGPPCNLPSAIVQPPETI